ncbi:hypothetical protein GPECTOR_1991g1017 [Gonium pectorale]|uniref:Uncharacterized protein n=1 Tax=Gonium pectorale TaxID=33097 RepID=A0A150FT88_GONPE|nr:hypothetical protein GPECTOR_1991g1017 [Gonium pectorale]|eukprot:KXZ40837.1 hypothetical protein GPECTOR_1991g1017 [Gonium pectorale]
MDTRLLLGGMLHMLRLPEAPPAALEAAPPPDDAGTAGAVAAQRQQAVLAPLHSHVAALQSALASTGLWSDRPELLATLTGRHFAALRDELWAAEAPAGEGLAAAPPAAAAAWGSAPRPLSEAALAAAAGGAMFLPELWGAMLEEAVPWVAVHAPLGVMQRLRLREAGA